MIVPVNENNKLWERKIGPCEILQKINDNANQIRLPSHLKTSDVFNVKHLTPCFVDADKDDLNSRASSFQPGKLMKENNNNKMDLLFTLLVFLFQ
jgi:hypothetical protein